MSSYTYAFTLYTTKQRIEKLKGEDPFLPVGGHILDPVFLQMNERR